jgi:hypothetical protein
MVRILCPCPVEFAAPDHSAGFDEDEEEDEDDWQ